MDPTIAIQHIQIVEEGPTDTHQMRSRAILYGPDGRPLNLTPAAMLLTGYEDAEGNETVEETDTVNEAIAKLEFRIQFFEDLFGAGGIDGTLRDADGRRFTIVNGILTAVV